MKKTNKAVNGSQKQAKSKLGFFVITVVLAVIAFAIYLNKQNTSVVIQAPTTVITPSEVPYQFTREDVLSSRKKIWNQYLLAADSVAQLTKDAEAIKLVKFARDYFKISVPSPSGIECLEDTNKGKFLSIVLFTAPDATVNQDWNNISRMKMTAAYLYPIKSVIMKSENPVGNLSRSLTLIHETKHALDDYRKWGRKVGTQPTGDTVAYEEKDVYEFMNTLNLKLGGARYKKLIDQYVEILRDSLEQCNGSIDAHYDPSMRDVSEVYDIFHARDTQYDHNVWKLSFRLQVYYAYIDRYYKGDKEWLKADYWLEKYIEWGMMKQEERVNMEKRRKK